MKVYQILDIFHPSLGVSIVQSNDCRFGDTPEERFTEFVRWLHNHNKKLEDCEVIC